MKITVILCTYNRCRRLAKALESAAGLSLPDQLKWEVLVVDNNSRDQTRQVVEEFSQRWPGRFRYLFEARQGKSYALNSGVREGRGEILAFTDDDVVLTPTWLQNLTSSLRVGECAGAGGRVLAETGFELPPWLPTQNRHDLAPLAIFDLGDVARDLNQPPFGANMAFHRSMFEKYGGFRTDLGPCPGSEIRGEDDEFGRRLLSQGERLRYDPSALVYHPVQDERLRQKYFLDWWYCKGRTDMRTSQAPSCNRWIVNGVPLYLLPRLAMWTLRWVISTKPSWRFTCKRQVWMRAGGIVEFYRQARSAKGQKARGTVDFARLCGKETGLNE
jgi:glycosyltransferase involved in cell wall biosynthesis